MSRYKVRVKELINVKASDLVRNNWNFRGHPSKQRQTINEVFENIGVAGAVIVRELEEPGKFQILDGHLRAEELGDEVIPAIVVDLDEEEAKLFLATYDPISSMAETDKEAFVSLVKEQEVIGPAICSLFNELGKGSKALNEKDLELDIETDDIDKLAMEEEPNESTELEESYVRMLHLFMNKDNVAIFEDMCAYVGGRIGTTTMTDTVFKGMEELKRVLEKREAKNGASSPPIVQKIENSESSPVSPTEEPKKKKKILRKV